MGLRAPQWSHNHSDRPKRLHVLEIRRSRHLRCLRDPERDPTMRLRPWLVHLLLGQQVDLPEVPPPSRSTNHRQPSYVGVSYVECGLDLNIKISCFKKLPERQLTMTVKKISMQKN